MSGVRRDAASSPSRSVPNVTSPVALWGVLNVTPDSFSDGGAYLDAEAAIARARVMLAEGADVIDVGGASSRPPGATYGAGAAPVDVAEEIRRTQHVVRALVTDLGARVSIDTTRGAVAREALAAGAMYVNDVSMGADPELLAATAEHGAELVLMHNRGDGRVPARALASSDVALAVLAELAPAIERAVRAGVPRERIWIDPGIGFAKTAHESAAVLADLGRITAGPHRVLVGASRKSFVAVLAPDPGGAPPGPSERLPGSLAALTVAVLAGAAAVRVHDVAASRQAMLVALALGPPRSGSDASARAVAPRPLEGGAHG